MISRKGVTPVEWCKCNQYEIALKPRRVPVISTTISPFLQINKKTTILNTPPILIFQTFPLLISLPQVGQPGLRGNHTKGPGEKYLDYLVGK